MSVAVSPYLLPSQALRLPQAQQTDLLDALLASCQKSAMNPRLPGYGRDLQPYFTTDILTSSASPASKAAPELSNKGKGKHKKAKDKSNNTSASSGSDEDTSQKHIRSPAKPTAKTQLVQDSDRVQTIKAIHKHEKAGAPAGRAWAGPAFGMAPAPSEIPTPSNFLLV